MNETKKQGVEMTNKEQELLNTVLTLDAQIEVALGLMTKKQKKEYLAQI